MLPVRAAERVVIYVVDTIDIERMEYEGSFDPRDAHVAVLDGTAAEPDDTLKNELDRRGLLIAGNILVQNPYRPEEYATIHSAAENFALDKFSIFSQLCQKLGAQSVRMRTLEETRGGKSMTVDIDGGNVITRAGGRGSALSAAAQTILSQKDMSDTFDGGEPDIRAARELLRENRLDADPMLRSLVDSRAHLANPHKTRHISVDLSQETANILMLAARVKTPAFFRIEADASSIASLSVHLRVDYVITFP